MTQCLLAAGGAIFIGTTMWSAWLGFNFSHSLGLVIFGALCIALAVGALSRWLLPVPVLLGVIYLPLAIRFWFRVPIIATALATMCFVAAWLVR